MLTQSWIGINEQGLRWNNLFLMEKYYVLSENSVPSNKKSIEMHTIYSHAYLFLYINETSVLGVYITLSITLDMRVFI
jgi:hypothetical protein